MTTAQPAEAFENVSLATEELAHAAIANPEVLPLLVQLAEATAQFCRGMAINREAAKFLSKKRRANYVVTLANSSDSQLIVNCYNFLDCIRQSLNCGINKEFRQCDIDEHYSRYSIEVYEKFFAGFKAQIAKDLKKKPEWAKAIAQYSDATLQHLREAL